MSKRPIPNFKAARYVDIQKHWRRLGPIYRSPEAFAIWKPCLLEFAQIRFGYSEKGLLPNENEPRHQWPSGYDCCDWKWDRKTTPPAFWKFTCSGACHWMVDLVLFVGASAWPQVPWRIIRAQKHSTVWNGDYRKPIVFDANCLAFNNVPGETLKLVWGGRHFRPLQFVKDYLHHQKTMRKKYPTRSLTEVPGWIKLTCQRCSGEFWSVPAQAIHTKFCSTTCNDEPPEIRFWKSVTKDGPIHPTKPELGCCWNSKFTPSADYPTMKVNGKTIKAANFILEVTMRKPLTKGLEVLHSCDNMRCVNPTHLSEDTHEENMRGMIERKRKAMGEQAGPSKLTVEQVKEIKLLNGQVTLKVAAAKYNVVIHTIWAIWSGKTWKDV